MKRAAAALFFAATLLAGRAPLQAALPIYIEDNHAGSFFWLAQHLDPDDSFVLLHFDAHSDASAVFDSDELRKQLRKVTTEEERTALLQRWRWNGPMECFNWIEPLLPSPIAQVIWIPGEKLEPTQRDNLEKTARAQLDGHLEASPRRCGSLRDRYVVSDFEHLGNLLPKNKSLIATIDLDYFAGVAEPELPAAFARVWDFVVAQKKLRAITFAISRPYLRDDEQAHRLVALALNAALSVPTAKIQFEPYQLVRQDHSRRSRDLRHLGMPVMGYDIAVAPDDLRARLLSEAGRIHVTQDAQQWNDLLKTWKNSAPELHVEIKDRAPSTDGVWRIPASEDAVVELVAQPWFAKLEKIEWLSITSRNACCNVSALDAGQVGFVANAAPQPVWQDSTLPNGGRSLSLRSLDNLFDPKTHCGAVRLRARATADGHVRETPVIEIRRQIGSGFRAALSEQFGLPYIFGSGELRDGFNTGPETNLGADCANFLVYAMRRQGLRVPWSDPKQLRQHLQLAERAAAPGQVHLTEADLQQGAIVHLGTHVAAVVEDRAPVGILDPNDLLVHQLKGRPETISLGDLLAERRQASFDFYKIAHARPTLASNPRSASDGAPSSSTLLFGGDVMLGRSVGERIRRGIDPFAGLRELFHRSQLVAVNLECAITERRPPQHKHGYAFAAPWLSSSSLREAGVRAVSLANNHAGDFGTPGLADSLIALHADKIAAVGIPADGLRFAPCVFSLSNRKKLALLGINDCPPSNQNESEELSMSLKEARTKADLVVCLVHWGEENSPCVTERQRELARLLIDLGADAIAGSHPHCVQPLDYYHGRPIAYSLGNLVFDGAPSVASWNRGALLRLGLTEDSRISSSELVPIVLKDGLPQTPASAVEAGYQLSKSETMVAK